LIKEMRKFLSIALTVKREEDENGGRLRRGGRGRKGNQSGKGKARGEY
jgi:hypothetical protein